MGDISYCVVKVVGIKTENGYVSTIKLWVITKFR